MKIFSYFHSQFAVSLGFSGFDFVFVFAFDLSFPYFFSVTPCCKSAVVGCKPAVVGLRGERWVWLWADY